MFPGLPAQYRKFARLFLDPADWRALPKHQPWDHQINLKEGCEPPNEKLRYHNYQKTQRLKEWVRMAAKKGYIRPSKSPAASNVLLAFKSDDPKGRPCGDYRALNAVTIRDVYPLPNAQFLRDRLAKAVVYTKLDQRNSFNLIRIREGDEWKTAFILPPGLGGLWEFTVMPFGLTNAPATCQRQNENILKKFLNETVICYLDDILVYSSTFEEHAEHVTQVLQALKGVDSRLKLEKCEFGVTQVKFLGYIISPGEMRIDPDKIKAVLDWPTPQNVKDVQSFNGFGNFCRQFIKNYSEIAAPLTALLRKDVKWKWTKEAQEAFELLKKAFTSDPVLKSFDENKVSIVEPDASGVAVGAVHLQPDDQGKLHPVAYYSEKHSSAEKNYDIYDQELMAVKKSLNHWKIYLQGAKYQVIILSDHKNLLRFTTTKVIDKDRHARWAEDLASYDFVIQHVKGKDNVRADALSRQPGYEGDRKYRMINLLKMRNGLLVPGTKEFLLMTSSEPWHPRILKSQETKIRNGFHPENLNLIKRGREYRKEGTNKLWVPSDLAKELITELHGLLAHGHQGIRRTIWRVNQKYYIQGLKQWVEEVVKGCDTCIRNKASRQAPYGLMKSKEIGEKPWETISWDFIGPLPWSEDPVTKVLYDSILIIMEPVTKYMILEPFMTNGTAEDLAHVFFKTVVMNHGLPAEIVSDRDKLFTSKFWTALTGLLGTKRKMTTAFHPQANGANERMNQYVETYIRMHTNHKQNNWVQLLPMAQFSYNSSPTETTKKTPFFANYGYEKVAYREEGQTEVESPEARLKAHQLKELHKELSKELQFVAERNAQQYNKKRSQEPTLKKGDMVYLLRRNIRTTRPSDKLDHKKLGPFKIKKTKGRLNYELALPATMKIHPVFHISLLEPAPPGAPKAPDTEVIPDPEKEYEVEQILDHKKVRNVLKYLVKWEGYPQSENTWEPRKNLNHCSSLVDQYHRQNPGHSRANGPVARNHPGRRGSPRRLPATRRVFESARELTPRQESLAVGRFLPNRGRRPRPFGSGPRR